MSKYIFFLASLLLTAHGAALAQSDMETVQISGYLRSTLLQSNTVLGPEQDYSLAANRLRLQLQGNITGNLAIDLQYDNDILLGSYLDTEQFRLQQHIPRTQYWRADSRYLRSEDVHGRHRLYRASLTFSYRDTDIKFGRQRIAWGTGRFWSPLDILNPIAPTQLDREERPGVDTLLVEQKLGPLSRASLVYAPQHDKRDDSLAALFHGNVSKIDYSIVWGKFREDHTLGFDIASQLGEAGIRSELTLTSPGTGKSYRRVLLGLDYAFANTLTVSAEWFYNGRGTTDTSRYDFGEVFNGRVQSLARRYAGLYAGYEITPLLKWNNYLAINLDDHSRYFSPRLTYSVTENLNWTIGMQLFGGSRGSEYGAASNLYYTELQWYF